jgi:hypothetical protein
VRSDGPRPEFRSDAFPTTVRALGWTVRVGAWSVLWDGRSVLVHGVGARALGPDSFGTFCYSTLV